MRGSKGLAGLLVAAMLWALPGCSCCSPSKPAEAITPANLAVISAIQPAAPLLESSHALPQAAAWVDPPVGWHVDKFDVDPQHTHVVWISPTGDTAYGVVLMNLPLPVGPEMVLWGFLNHLRTADHRADLLQKIVAPELPGLRFVAESGLYRIRVNLIVRDWRAWAVYAGTLVNRPENAPELDLALLARDGTRVGFVPRNSRR